MLKENNNSHVHGMLPVSHRELLKYRVSTNDLSGLKYLFDKNKTAYRNVTCTTGRRISKIFL
jgi:hypothetical protein